MDNREDNNKLIVYFMGQTNERLVQIEKSMNELLSFRAEVLASAKTTSIIVGSSCSILSIVLGYFLRKVGM